MLDGPTGDIQMNIHCMLERVMKIVPSQKGGYNTYIFLNKSVGIVCPHNTLHHNIEEF